MPGNKEIKHAILNLEEFKMQLEMKDQIEETMRHQSIAEIQSYMAVRVPP